jgi:hypothetical protein
VADLPGQALYFGVQGPKIAVEVLVAVRQVLEPLLVLVLGWLVGLLEVVRLLEMVLLVAVWTEFGLQVPLVKTN